MPRLATLLASSALFGCGGGAERATVQEREADAPVVALAAYLDAVVAEDWARACDLLSDEGLVMREWEKRGGCAENMAKSGGPWVAPNTREAMDQGDYVLEVEGDAATVTPEGTGSYSLVREGGEWLVLEPS